MSNDNTLCADFKNWLLCVLDEVLTLLSVYKVFFQCLWCINLCLKLQLYYIDIQRVFLVKGLFWVFVNLPGCIYRLCSLLLPIVVLLLRSYQSNLLKTILNIITNALSEFCTMIICSIFYHVQFSQYSSVYLSRYLGSWTVHD